jgi:hypothetical protein
MYAIGDPGRAAVELPAGPPPARVGPADVELSSADVGEMTIRAASSRGLLHRGRHTVRQDAFALGRRAVAGEPESAIIVVCDGVGSLERSDEAALLASRRLAELSAAGASWEDAFRQVNEELRKYAGLGLDGGPPADMATTAVAARVYQDGAAWAGEAAWVGDSSLWHLDDQGGWTLIAGPPPQPEDDAYHSGRVRPLPSAYGECSTTRFQLRGGAMFAMTDGVANPLQWGPDVRAALAQWWVRPPDQFTFAAQVGFARRTHIDDRTVVGIWRSGHAGQQGEPWAAETAVPGRLRQDLPGGGLPVARGCGTAGVQGVHHRHRGPGPQRYRRR